MESLKAIVWSKNSCAWCVAVKDYLKQKGIEVEERNIDTDYSIEELREVVPNVRTLPQVFIDNKYIGGYQEVLRHFT